MEGAPFDGCLAFSDEASAIFSEKWGWYYYTNSATCDALVFNVFAGAGQNDILHKGEWVGTVTVSMCAEGNRVAYDIEENVEEMHFHISARPPLQYIKKDNTYVPTAAPGKYEDLGCALGGECYVIIHFVVGTECEERRLAEKHEHFIYADPPALRGHAPRP